jgi:hypothetical protein
MLIHTAEIDAMVVRSCPVSSDVDLERVDALGCVPRNAMRARRAPRVRRRTACRVTRPVDGSRGPRTGA